MQSSVIRRSDEIKALNTLFPPSRNNTRALFELAWDFSLQEWKGLLIRYWQEQAQQTAEIEDRIRERGGEHDAEPARIDMRVHSARSASIDTELILTAIHQQSLLSQAYADLRGRPLSFNLQTMLRRHHEQIQERIERLSQLSLLHVPRSTEVPSSRLFQLDVPSPLAGEGGGAG